jgi:hypothetical protein
MEELVPSQTKAETADSLRAGAVGAPATFDSFVPTNRKKKWRQTYRLLGTTSLKGGRGQCDMMTEKLPTAI